MVLSFQLNYTDDFNPCVEIEGSKRKYLKWEEISEDFPDLPKKAREEDKKLIWLLAQSYEHLSPTQQKLIHSQEKLEEEIADWAEPGMEKLRRWYSGESISAPPLSSLTGPAWDGDELVLYTYNFDWGGSSRYLFVARHRLSFGESWEFKRENLDGQEPLQLTKTSTLAEELFGGKVGGFLKAKAPLEKERLYLSVDREEGAVPYVWWPEGTEPKRYESFATLTENHPEATGGKLLASLGDEIESYWGDRGVRHHNYQCIADGVAYLEEYRSKGWGTFKLRYWVDQLATWDLDVPDLDSVSSPQIENEVLTAYFKGDKYQPCRMVIDLSTLTLKENPVIETMATEKLISDTGGYHGGPTLAFESPEISRISEPEIAQAPEPEILSQRPSFLDEPTDSIAELEDIPPPKEPSDDFDEDYN